MRDGAVPASPALRDDAPRIITEGPGIRPGDATPVTVRPDTAGDQAALIRDGNRPDDRPEALQPHPRSLRPDHLGGRIPFIIGALHHRGPSSSPARHDRPALHEQARAAIMATRPGAGSAPDAHGPDEAGVSPP